MHLKSLPAKKKITNNLSGKIAKYIFNTDDYRDFKPHCGSKKKLTPSEPFYNMSGILPI
jgi:hypothetical protein